MSDETHDIRYLHDKNMPDDSIIKDDDMGSLFNTKKIGIILGVIVLLGLGTILILQITKGRQVEQSKSIHSEAGTSTEQTVIPTITTKEIQGTVICLNDTKATESNPECNLGIQEKTGEVFALENVQYDAIVSGQVAVGKTVSITGTTQTTSSQQNGQNQNQNQEQPTTIYVAKVEDPPPGSIPTETPMPPTPTDVPAEQD